MITTLSTLREEMSRILEDWLEVNTTTNITTNNYIFSTELQPYGDGYFKGQWAVITSGNNIGACRQIKDFVQESGRIEVYGSALASESGAVTVEVHRLNPTHITEWINRAALRAFPMLSVLNLTPNAHFEDWSQASYPDYWRVAGVTAIAETGAGNFHGGVKSAKVTRAGTDGYLYISTQLANELPQDVINSLFRLRGSRVTLAKWVKATTAAQARLVIYCGDATTTKYSPFHTGGGAWEYLEVAFDIPWNASVVEFRCEVIGSDGSVYFDGAGQSQRTAEDYLAFVSTLSAATDAVEINNDEAMALASLAASMMLDAEISPAGTDSVGRIAGQADRIREKANKSLMALMSNLPPIQIGRGWTKYWPAE